MKLKISTSVLLLALTSCQAVRIDNATNQYFNIRDQISLGDSKDTVATLLERTQIKLKTSERKPSEAYIEDGSTFEILYARSLRQADGITTDDEFTPYLFKDGKLVGIGWQAIGGPNTQGQVVPRTNVYIERGD